MSCADALPMLSAKLEAITALIEEAKARKTRIEALMAEMTAGKPEAAVAHPARRRRA
ncbi:hypothetical protein [Arenibacterium halophilum]|uniref:hypothetical protein n=1 Tax=Arenibacterium halophilum TaxID=2583821 RepID=UPI001486EC13|nr:hypothetical protein [Arenibacterium halophilum]